MKKLASVILKEEKTVYKRYTKLCICGKSIVRNRVTKLKFTQM